jgi:hypothetical protein
MLQVQHYVGPVGDTINHKITIYIDILVYIYIIYIYTVRHNYLINCEKIKLKWQHVSALIDPSSSHIQCVKTKSN